MYSLTGVTWQESGARTARAVYNKTKGGKQKFYYFMLTKYGSAQKCLEAAVEMKNSMDK